MALASLASLGFLGNWCFTSQFHIMSSLGFHGGDTSATCLAMVTVFSQEGEIPQPFLVSLTIMPESCFQSCQVLLFLGAGSWTTHPITSSLSFCFEWSPSVPKTGCAGTHLEHQTGLELRDSLCLSPKCRDLRCTPLCLDLNCSLVPFHNLEA